MLCNGSLLVIHFQHSSVYTSTPNSVTIPSPILPLGNHRLFPRSLRHFLFGKQVRLYHFFLDSTYKGYHMIFLFLCRTYFTQYDALGKFVLSIPGGASGKKPTCQCRRHKRGKFSPWVRKIPWRRAWQSIPVFLPGESTDRGAWRATQSKAFQRASHN